jgi:hypothetical protein
MADSEIRRRKTSDPELDALIVLEQALSPLSRVAAGRVLRWAEERYTRDADVPVADLQAINAWMSGIQQVAREMGAVPLDVIKAAAATCVREQRELESADA